MNGSRAIRRWWSPAPALEVELVMNPNPQNAIVKFLNEQAALDPKGLRAFLFTCKETNNAAMKAYACCSVTEKWANGVETSCWKLRGLEVLNAILDVNELPAIAVDELSLQFESSSHLTALCRRNLSTAEFLNELLLNDRDMICKLFLEKFTVMRLYSASLLDLVNELLKLEWRRQVYWGNSTFLEII